jgi:hypothetical protein
MTEREQPAAECRTSALVQQQNTTRAMEPNATPERNGAPDVPPDRYRRDRASNPALQRTGCSRCSHAGR